MSVNFQPGRHQGTQNGLRKRKRYRNHSFKVRDNRKRVAFQIKPRHLWTSSWAKVVLQQRQFRLDPQYCNAWMDIIHQIRAKVYSRTGHESPSQLILIYEELKPQDRTSNAVW